MIPPFRRTARGLGWFATLATGIALASLPSCGAPGDGENSRVDEIQVCPSGSTVLGVDVSEYQGTINWASVKSSGRQFAIARIGDGTSTDPTFARNWSGIRSAGMIRGAYQFFRPNLDPTAQADIVVNAVGHLGDGDLPVVADVEVSGGQSASTIVSRLRTWLAAVESGTGKKPMVYTAQYFWNSSVGGSSAFASYPLWVANYGVSCPNMPTGWSGWQVWQYSSTGTVAGISGNVDLDKFNGSLAQLQTFAGAPAYAAQFVSQSFPYASQGSVQIHAGQSQSVSITMRNVGTATWNSSTRLATTMPRDRSSVFYGTDWVAADRPDAVSGTVAPGGTYQFTFKLHAPAATGRYDEYFGMVQEGVTWFSAAGQGGPPDDQLEAIVDVLAPVATGDAGNVDAARADATSTDAMLGDVAASDASHGDVAVADARTDTDVAVIDARGDVAMTDGRSDAGDAGDAGDGAMDSGVTSMSAGCQCSAPGQPVRERAGLRASVAGLLVGLALRRRRVRRLART